VIGSTVDLKKKVNAQLKAVPVTPMDVVVKYGLPLDTMCALLPVIKLI